MYLYSSGVVFVGLPSHPLRYKVMFFDHISKLFFTFFGKSCLFIIKHLYYIMTLTDKEKKSFVDKHLTKIYPQLKINMEKTCGVGAPRWADDLLSIAVEYFLKKHIDVQYESCVNNKAENFITYIANFQLKSGYSKFWHIHRKFTTSTREYFVDNHQYDIEKEDIWADDDRMLCIKEAINDLDPYRKMLVEERVLKGMRFQDLAERYDIPYSSLTLTLKQTLKEVKEKCKHLQSYL